MLKYQIFVKIRAVGAELFLAGRQRGREREREREEDRQTDMTRLIDAFHNFFKSA